ncbi:MAG: ComEC/Rec2 family competence protein [Candidatus Firestonebacteria bacterium]|mgnify:CR=1 FL=1
MRQPLLYLTISYIIGIIFAANIFIPFLIIFIGLSLLLLLYLIIIKNKTSLIKNGNLLLIVFLIGALFYNIHTQIYPENHIKHIVSGEKRQTIGKELSAEVTGVLIQDSVKELEKHKIQLLVDINEINGKKTSGLVLVSAYGNITRIDCNYGDVVRIKGKIYSPEPPKNPGEFNYTAYLARKKIFAVMSTTLVGDEGLSKIDTGKGNFFIGIAYKIKAKVTKILYTSMPFVTVFPAVTLPVFPSVSDNNIWHQTYLQAGLLDGLMLGNEKALPMEYREMFRDTGTMHILAVSGLNVGFMVFIFFTFLRFLSLNKRISSGITIIFIILFATITGSSASVLRASIMAITVLIAYFLERDTDIYNSLALSALIILVVSPLSLFDVGFQLSYVATIGIIYVASLFEKVFSPLPKFIRVTLAVTLSAQLAVYPFLTYYFNKVSLISVFANIVIVPLASLSTALGFVTTIIGFISIEIAKIFGSANWFILTLNLESVNLFSKIPYAVLEVCSPSFIFIVSYYLLFLLIGFKNFNIRQSFAVIIVLIIVNLNIWGKLILPLVQNDARFTFFALKKNIVYFVQLPDNKSLFIFEKCDSLNKKNIDTLRTFLLKEGIGEIDALVAFSDFSNTQDMDILINGFKIKNIFSAKNGSLNTASNLKLLELILHKKIYYKTFDKNDKILVNNSKYGEFAFWDAQILGKDFNCSISEDVSVKSDNYIVEIRNPKEEPEKWEKYEIKTALNISTNGRKFSILTF